MEIEVKNLNKKFDNILAVNNLNFKIKKNKTLGLLGPNGCGKTTTIGMMLGLIKPSNGQIIINNFDINKTDKNLILKYINFASPYVELPKKLTVRENLEVYARLYDIPKINDRISELVDELSLNKFIDKKSGELSSGQKNRVSLAKSLINKQKYFSLMSTASLDPDIGDFVRNYITEYKKQNDVTILLASHNMDEVEKLCDSIVMMKLGEIVDRGTCQDLINKHGRNNLEETFLKIARSNNELE